MSKINLQIGSVPTLVKRNIFTDAEVKSMISMIDQNDRLITKAFTPPLISGDIESREGAKIFFGTFGTPWYVNWKKFEQYRARGLLTESILMKTVPYHRIIDSIFEITGQKCQIAADLNPPGFHVFANLSNQLVTVDYANWHRDLFAVDHYVQSFTIPLEIPKAGAGVNFKMDDGMIKYHPYEYNCLHAWHGSLLHSIAPVTLAPGERRVSLQVHVLDQSQQQLIYW